MPEEWTLVWKARHCRQKSAYGGLVLGHVGGGLASLAKDLDGAAIESSTGSRLCGGVSTEDLGTRASLCRRAATNVGVPWYERCHNMRFYEHISEALQEVLQSVQIQHTSA